MRSLLITAILSSAIFGGFYIVPQEYDNMRNASTSGGFAIINNTTPTLSNNSYTIGGKVVKFRCSQVTKIACKASNAEINAYLSEYSLKRPTTEDLLMAFQVDLRIEEDSTNWYLCGGAYGGQVWDDANLTSTENKDSSGKVISTTINFSYTPNVNTEEYWYFTDQSNTSTQSYMTISYHQQCR